MKPMRQLAIVFALCAATPWSLADDAKKDATAAPAAPAAPAKTAEATDKSAPKDRKLEMVCTSERVTGSRFSRKICHTREEREMMQRAGRETVEKIQEMPVPLKGE
jgi:hypothetical protein